MQEARLTAWVHGLVQGVGFRWWCTAQARELGLAGHATNLVDGRVCVVAEGKRADCEELLARLQAEHYKGRPGMVEAVVEQWGTARGERGFIER